MTADTTKTFKYDILVADAIAQAATVTPELRDAVKALILTEQAEAMAAVLRRLNSGVDDKDWQMIKREPMTVIVMLVQEHAKRLETLLLSRTETKEVDGE